MPTSHNSSKESRSEKDRQLEELLARAALYFKMKNPEPGLKFVEKQRAQVA
jgi:hypothetical protein